MIISLTAFTDYAPVPRVEIALVEEVTVDGGGVAPLGDSVDGGGVVPAGDSFTGGGPQLVDVAVPAGTDSFTLWWRSQGRSERVSGVIRRGFSGPVKVLDLEGGFDVPTEYELECFDGDVSLGRFGIGSIVLPWDGDANGVLIQQPLDPTLHVVAVNLEGSWPSITRGASGESVRTEGAVLGRLVGSGPRQGVAAVDVDFAVTSTADAEMVWGTLGTQDRPQLQVWLIRSHQGILPRRFFARVGDLTEIDVDSADEWSRFQATVEEIARPVPGLIISPLSYTDLDVSFASYTEMDAAFPSYSARDSAWEYAGASGGA